jgi:hypothetical protein
VSDIPTSIPVPNPSSNPFSIALRLFTFASSLQLFKEACKLVKAASSSVRSLSDSCQSVCKLSSFACSCSISFKRVSLSLSDSSSLFASSSEFLFDSAACCRKVSFNIFNVSIVRAASARRLCVSSSRQSKGSAGNCCDEKSNSKHPQLNFLFHILFP